MIIALSTRWNASRHASGDSMADEILEAGFSHLELGYDLHAELLPGLHPRLLDGSIRVDSIHAPCPIPMGMPEGHPELYTLADTDETERSVAVRLVSDSILLAADLGARTVVAHAGNVEMPHYSYSIMARLNAGKTEGWWNRWQLKRLRARLAAGRSRSIQAHLDALSRSIEALLPLLETTGIRLALENLPSWESIPSETELSALLEKFPSPRLGAWYDIGHSAVREKLGFSTPFPWLDSLGDRLAGMHIHDMDAKMNDHLAPGAGIVDFTPFRKWAEQDMLKVMEVRPGLPVDALKAGLAKLRAGWESTDPS
jgi:sugar phosphate isomerase/epimerase